MACVRVCVSVEKAANSLSAFKSSACPSEYSHRTRASSHSKSVVIKLMEFVSPSYVFSCVPPSMCAWKCAAPSSHGHRHIERCARERNPSKRAQIFIAALRSLPSTSNQYRSIEYNISHEQHMYTQCTHTHTQTHEFYCHCLYESCLSCLNVYLSCCVKCLLSHSGRPV